MEENKGYSAVIGSSSAPYINGLANANVLATNQWGVSHPSLPNYLAFVSGSTQGVTSDCTTCGPFSGAELGGQLTAAGISWKSYQEDMPSACFTGGSSGNYAKKHDPFVYFNDVLTNGCSSHIVPFSQFATDMANGTLPTFIFVTPNLMNDMHTGTVAQGDAWLKANIDPLLHNPWFTGNAAGADLILTMDESIGDATNGGGHIPTVVVSSSGKHLTDTTFGNHYGLLRAIEESYGLPLLGGAASPSNGDLRPLF
jgi:acid phosphatase